MRYLVTQARRQWYPLRRPCLHLCVCMYLCVSLLAPWNTLRCCCVCVCACVCLCVRVSVCLCVCECVCAAGCTLEYTSALLRISGSMDIGIPNALQRSGSHVKVLRSMSMVRAAFVTSVTCTPPSL